MGLILMIETATEVCSVALSLNGKLLALKESLKGNSHSENIAVFIDDILKENGKLPSELDAVAVSKGPGSYTGLRIGVSSAKGLCFALSIPLISVNTLQSMATGLVNSCQIKDNVLLCPMIDARRMEVYSALYNTKLEMIRGVQADIVDHTTYAEYIQNQKLYFFGNGAEKCREVLGNHPNIKIIENITLSAKNMIALAEEKFAKSEFENVAYFEPFYLKDFIAAKAVVKGLY